MNPPILRRSPLGKTHEPLLNNAPRGRRRAGEVAGGTAAECTAIFCCFPCTVMNIVVLAVYKVPAGLCRKAIHKYKRKPQPRKLKKNDDVLLKERSSATCQPSYYVGTTLEEHLASEKEREKAMMIAGEFSEMETEMWALFNGTGFWRCPSQQVHS